MGVTFAHRVAEDRGLGREKPVLCYLAARDIFQSESRFQAIEALDGKLPCADQYHLMESVSGLLKHASLWLLRNMLNETGLASMVERFAGQTQTIEAALDEVLPVLYLEQRQIYQQDMQALSVDKAVAHAYANHHVLGSVLDITLLTEACGFAVLDVARVYFALGARLRLPWLLAQINSLRVEDRWQALARNNLREEAYNLHRQVVNRALQSDGDGSDARVSAWTAANAAQLEFSERRLIELEALNKADFAGVMIALGELARLSL
jgi:glutamate dehydrogenase